MNETLSLYPTKKVTVVGPSLGGSGLHCLLWRTARSGSIRALRPEGAAIALLDAVFLPLHLPKDVTVRYIGYSSFRLLHHKCRDYTCDSKLLDKLHSYIQSEYTPC